MCERNHDLKQHFKFNKLKRLFVNSLLVQENLENSFVVLTARKTYRNVINMISL